jgi:GTP:adenosylcobinamide-phosphate guanylyltransferase
VIPAVVIAAGLGTRLRPLTERYAKPVLPVDGVPVLARLLRDLAEAGVPRATVVTGHLAEQVERLGGDGSGFGLELAYARQPSPDGSADAVKVAAVAPPYLVLGADAVFAPGDVGRFAAAFAAGGAAGAVAVEPRPGTVELEDGRVRRLLGEGLLAAPLWAVGPPVHERLCLDEKPWELRSAFQLAIDSDEVVHGVEIAPTRGLTTPFDVLEQNFAYLEGL